MLGSANVTVSVVLLALVVGVLLPVLVQLFVTLRTLQRVVISVDQRLERTLNEVSGLAARFEQTPGNHSTAAAIGAAVAPAIVAAIQSFRHRDHDPAETESLKPANGGRGESEVRP